MVNDWMPLFTRPVTAKVLLRKCPFSGWRLTWALSLCASHFLSRGSRLSRLVKCERQSGGRQTGSVLGLDGPRSKSFSSQEKHLWHLGKLLLPFLKRMLIKNPSLGVWEG